MPPCLVPQFATEKRRLGVDNREHRWRAREIVCTVWALLSACTGGSDGPEGSVVLPFQPGAPSQMGPGAEPGSQTEGTARSLPMACQDAAIHSERAPLRRLTRFEYNNTVRDLFGDNT